MEGEGIYYTRNEQYNIIKYLDRKLCGKLFKKS